MDEAIEALINLYCGMKIYATKHHPEGVPAQMENSIDGVVFSIGLLSLGNDSDGVSMDTLYKAGVHRITHALQQALAIEVTEEETNK